MRDRRLIGRFDLDRLAKLLQQRSLGVAVTNDDWLGGIVAWKDHRQRNTHAVERFEPACDLWRIVSPIGFQRDHIMLIDERQRIGSIQRQLFVDLASQTPLGGEVDQHGSAIQQLLLHRLTCKRLPR